MKGYDLKSGEYENRHLSEEELWNAMNWLFSSRSKNDSSYKFIFFKSVLDCMETDSSSEIITFDMVFYRFTQIAWALVLKYGIRQKAATRGKTETYLEQIIHYHAALNSEYADFLTLPIEWQKQICHEVKIKCKTYVIGALYGDTNGLFYSFDKKKEWIKINPQIRSFIERNRAVIENLNYYKWASFYADKNDLDVAKGLEKMIEKPFIRKGENIYRSVLAYEFERLEIERENRNFVNSLDLLFGKESIQNIEEKDFENDNIESILFEDFDVMRQYLADPILLIQKLKKEKGLLK